MKPMKYEDITDWEAVAIELEDHRRITGWFSSMRVDKSTLPEGMNGYSLREDPSSGEFMSIEPKVIVDHAGDFITKSALKFPHKDPYFTITDFAYIDSKEVH